MMLLNVIVVFLNVYSTSCSLVENTRLRQSLSNDGHHHNGLFAVDLTHTMSDMSPVTDGASPLEMIRENMDDGYGGRSEFYEFCMDEKLGTHLVAPSMHLSTDALNRTLTADNLPLSLLVHLPAVVIDLAHEPGRYDTSLTREHLSRWEREHGKIPQGAFVMLRTGWSKFYGQPDKFLGHFEGQNKQVFPGFSFEATEWLLNNRYVSGLGSECIDVELAWKTNNKVKTLLAAQNKISVVQLTNLEALPPTGSHVTVAPLKLAGGGGGPARVFAVASNNRHHHHNKPHHGSRNNHHRSSSSPLQSDSSKVWPSERTQRGATTDSNSSSSNDDSSNSATTTTTSTVLSAAAVIISISRYFRQ